MTQFHVCSPVGRVESFRSWSSHLFRGRPGGRRHVRSGGRLSDTLVCSWRAMFAGVTSSSRATCPQSQLHDADNQLFMSVLPNTKHILHHYIPECNYYHHLKPAYTIKNLYPRPVHLMTGILLYACYTGMPVSNWLQCFFVKEYFPVRIFWFLIGGLSTVRHYVSS